MYLQLNLSKIVQNRPFFSSSQHANLPPKMSALLDGRIKKYDVE